MMRPGRDRAAELSDRWASSLSQMPVVQMVRLLACVPMLMGPACASLALCAYISWSRPVSPDIAESLKLSAWIATGNIILSLIIWSQIAISPFGLLQTGLETIRSLFLWDMGAGPGVMRI